MKVYGLIGNPLTHSFSYRYFSEKFLREHIVGITYRNFEIDNLPSQVPSLKADPDICGLNVTIPYKSAILDFLDEVSPECAAVGACNCIKIVNEKWTGYNTDCIGFENSFIKQLQPHHQKALILGTGGSSKAVAFVLRKLKIDYRFVTRGSKTHPLLINYNEVTPSLLDAFQVIINTTPSGMFPNVLESPEIPYDALTNSHYC
ncbi:MAG: shikimate dehydrogenase, partial [Ginsengibacter sp.]